MYNIPDCDVIVLQVGGGGVGHHHQVLAAGGVEEGRRCGDSGIREIQGIVV